MEIKKLMLGFALGIGAMGLLDGRGVLAETASETPKAATPAKLDGAKLYVEKACVACHGADGDTPILPSYPKLVGQNAAYAAQQMRDIKSGARANAQAAAMKGMMHLVSDEEIEVLAEWLSQKKE